MKWEVFWKVILGEMPLESFLAYFALMCAGAIVFFAMDERREIKKNGQKFSWAFMIRDNLLRGASVLIIIMACVLWYDSFFGVPINARLAFMQGLSIDAVMGLILKEGKERGPLKKSQQKLKQKYL